eukprot:NODE_6596_length_554_cov_1.996040_g6176_i0.p1 GENE.NODE_6596_length_554_cov_1.996040_g6176_i0~~NODE_6596_length_554_cov_1.996040_g6176_i0.p1  ORF type:complete len:149 (-),score=35.74 NODE_6596_length_554_cov_1.996040_g6176_i0:108-503(-)
MSLEDARNVFDMIDVDGSGTMDQDEFANYYVMEGFEYQAPSRFDDWDGAGGAGGGQDEMSRKARAGFRQFDKDNSNSIDVREFREACSSLNGYEMSLEEAQAVFDAIDVDGSGIMEEDEFIGYYTMEGFGL